MSKSKKAPNPTDKHIGDRIRMRRLQLNRSQGWLGEQLGLTFQQIQKYERGMNRVGGSRLGQIAVALKAPPAWFFEGAPHTFEVAGPGAKSIGPSLSLHNDFFNAAGALELAGDYLTLTSENKRVVLGVASALARAHAIAALKKAG